MTTKTPNFKDRRVRRTHQLLRDALISLILERGYHSVTIRDVVKRAGVGRSTFYIHFGDLEELLLSQGDGQWLNRFTALGHDSRKPFAFVRPFLDHANERRALWRALVGNKGGVALRKHFKERLLARVRQDVSALTGKQHARAVEATARYVSGAFSELLFWWLDCPSHLASTDIDNIFQTLTA